MITDKSSIEILGRDVGIKLSFSNTWSAITYIPLNANRNQIATILRSFADFIEEGESDEPTP